MFTTLDSLQLIMGGFRCGQLGHRHHVYHHTGPAGEVLSTLATSRLGVVLLPGKASLLPLAEDILNQVLSQGVIEPTCLLLMRARCSSSILRGNVRNPWCNTETLQNLHIDSSTPSS